MPFLLSWSSIILSSKNTSSGLPDRQIGAPLITHCYYMPFDFIFFFFPLEQSETNMFKKKKKSLHGERNITDVITKLLFFSYKSIPISLTHLSLFSPNLPLPLSHVFFLCLLPLPHTSQRQEQFSLPSVWTCFSKSSPRTIVLLPWCYLKTISTQHPSRRFPVLWAQVITLIPSTLPGTQ